MLIDLQEQEHCQAINIKAKYIQCNFSWTRVLFLSHKKTLVTYIITPELFTAVQDYLKPKTNWIRY